MPAPNSSVSSSPTHHPECTSSCRRDASGTWAWAVWSSPAGDASSAGASSPSTQRSSRFSERERRRPASRTTYPPCGPLLPFCTSEGAPELITDYLQDEVLAEEPAAVVRALAALAAIGGCTTDDLADATAPVLQGLPSIVRDDVLDRVAELPLVGRGSSGCWPHPVWVRATRSTLNQEERRLVVDGRIAALLDHGAVSEAGRMAVEVAGTDALRAVVRSALAGVPVSASVHDLRVLAAIRPPRRRPSRAHVARRRPPFSRRR